MALLSDLQVAFLSRMPPVYQTRLEEADGTKIPREEWFKPKPGMLPEPMSEESKEKTKEIMAKQDPEVVKQRMEGLRKTWEKSVSN